MLSEGLGTPGLGADLGLLSCSVLAFKAFCNFFGANPFRTHPLKSSKLPLRPRLRFEAPFEPGFNAGSNSFAIHFVLFCVHCLKIRGVETRLFLFSEVKSGGPPIYFL